MILAALTESLGLILLVPLLELRGIGEGPDAAIPRHIVADFSLETLLLGFTALIAMRAAIVYARTLASVQFEAAVIDRLRSRAWRGLLHCNWRVFLGMKRSDSASLLINRVDQAGDFVNQAIASASTAATLVGIGIAALVISPCLAVAASATGMALLALLYPARRRARDLGEQLGMSHATIHGIVTERLSAMRAIKAHGLEKQAEDELGQAFADVRQGVVAFHRANGKSQATLHILGAALLALLIWQAITRWHVAVSAVVPMVALLARGLPLIGLLQQTWSNAVHARPAVDDALALIVLTERAAEPVGALPAPTLQHKLRLDGVSVHFRGEARAVLHAVSLDIDARGITALTGPSGAGKSTLADVLGGLLDPSEGRLLIDGIDIHGPVRRAWRQRVAYVQQDPLLISASLRDNLRWAASGASDADLERVLKAAAADFAFNLPQGLDTLLGDGGRLLSGGERQRLMLARALLRDPALLILDEATSALDLASELQIATALRALAQDMAILVISHRGALLDLARQTVRLEKGRLVPQN